MREGERQRERETPREGGREREREREREIQAVRVKNVDKLAFTHGGHARQKMVRLSVKPSPDDPQHATLSEAQCTVCVECLFLRTPGSGPTSQWG